MSETKFTPGPWMDASFEDETNDSQIFSQETYQSPGDPTEKRVHIATVYDNDANARLIASAPELLAALLAFRACAEYMEACDVIANVQRLADNAILKAKGQP